MTDDDTERTLGRLLATAEATNRSLEQAAQQRADMRATIATMATSVQTIRGEVAGLHGKVEQVCADVSEMKPVTEMVTGIKGKVMTGLGAIAMVGGGLIWFFTWVWSNAQHIRDAIGQWLSGG